MKLKWLGHSCFLITSETGLRIITDPYSTVGGINYSPVNEAAGVVTVSHDHRDHNNVAAVPGKPEVITGSGTKTAKGIQFKGIASHHDKSKGKERGANTIFCFTVDGIRLCHLGDIGHELSREEIAQIGNVDVLLVPIGGVFTIDAKVASEVVDDLKPKVIAPMHYKTPKCDFPITGVEDFLAGKKNVKKLNSSETEFKAGKLPEATEIVVLQSAL
ncbi:MAG: MBL fold metallo-hydrolase [Dehalococcoidia bacterium]|nr:MBL fold metallo-hydrolase [Dehalococcoidia bacterium]